MYEQASHALLNDILTKLRPGIGNAHMRHFYTRLGANFYAIHSLFDLLYGERDDFKDQMYRLVETLAMRYLERSPRLRDSDMAREKNYNWFLSQKWVGMALYAACLFVFRAVTPAELKAVLRREPGASVSSGLD